MRLRWLGLVMTCAAGCAFAPGKTPPPTPSAVSILSGTSSISGRVSHQETKEPLSHALMLLHSRDLPVPLEAWTDDNGLYAFRGLPAGTYTVQVLYAGADQSKMATLPADAKFHAHFKFDPDRSIGCSGLPSGPGINRSLMSLSEHEARILGRPNVTRNLAHP